MKKEKQTWRPCDNRRNNMTELLIRNNLLNVKELMNGGAMRT